MIRIDVLPDEVLLEIFDFYVSVKEQPLYDTKTDVEAWHSLVHVCRRWRRVVFGSSHRLNLKLYCTPTTPSRDTLDVWPALPLIIKGDLAESSGVDNIIVALGQTNRVCEVKLRDAGQPQLLEKVLATMQVPFPELTGLRLALFNNNETPPIADSFLGGSAPCLRDLELWSVPFPGLQKLLLSATHLVKLDLWYIPHSGYISPNAMVAVLSVLSSLKELHFIFESPQSRPDLESRRPPPSKRSVIPSLTQFIFNGVSEYLEDLVTCIDTPQLDYLEITFFDQIDINTPRLTQFINRTPEYRARDEAHVVFDDSTVHIELTYRTHEPDHVPSWIEISCREPQYLQLSSISRVCNSCLPRLSMVEDLYIEPRYGPLIWMNDAIENNLWPELLRSFTAVKNLYLDKELVPGIAAALEELVSGTKKR